MQPPPPGVGGSVLARFVWVFSGRGPTVLGLRQAWVEGADGKLRAGGLCLHGTRIFSGREGAHLSVDNFCPC